MKALLFSILCVASLVGCTTYPKNYTYSPTVTINGKADEVVLPDPFSNGRKTQQRPIKTQYRDDYSYNQSTYVPIYSGSVPPPYSYQTYQPQCYEADPDARYQHSRTVYSRTVANRDIDGELGSFIIP
jgi:hypothetical protein